jgi:hypothetical protein
VMFSVELSIIASENRSGEKIEKNR